MGKFAFIAVGCGLVIAAARYTQVQKSKDSISLKANDLYDAAKEHKNNLIKDERYEAVFKELFC
jgi:hypothetical protein